MRRLLLALLLALTLPTSAPAATDVPSGPVGASFYRTLVLVEDGVVWARPVGRNEAAIMGGRPDGTVRALVRVTGGPLELSSNGSLAMLTSWPHVWNGTVDGGFQRADIGPHGCTPRGKAEADADVMAFGVFCGGTDMGLLVRGPAGVERRFPATHGVEVAGRYVAWTASASSQYSEGGTVVVYDVVADREVLRAGSPGFDGSPLYPIDLQPDGKLLVGLGESIHGPPDAETAWLSPDEPELHRLGIPSRTVHGFARDRILTLTDSDHGEDRERLPPPPTRAVLVGLDGSRRLIASARGNAKISEAHYDGRRVALALVTCDGTRILLRSAAERAPAISAGGLCPLTLTGRVVLTFVERRRVANRGFPRVRVPVRCASFALRPCTQLEIRALEGQELGLAATLRYPSSGAYTVELSDDGIRRIAREGSMRVRLVMRPSGLAGPPLQRPATTVLRVAPRELARLRRCVRERPSPATSGCAA